MHAGRRAKVLGIAEVDQRVEAIGTDRHDIAAASAIAAIGAAEFDELFTVKADGAAAAIAGCNIDLGLIEKFHVRRAFQTPSVNCVSICSTSASRARQSSQLRPL
ncbi:hypothetical protein D3C87_1828750 [compost metagenome]